jgi:uncharacterized protein
MFALPNIWLKQTAIKKLTQLSQKGEEDFIPNDHFDQLIQKERDDAYRYGGRTIKGFSAPYQTNLFDKPLD